MNNSTWLEKDKSIIWHPFTPLQNEIETLMVTSGEGVYLHTENGQKIIDAVSSWWVNLHGHSHPKIVKAIADQAASLEHVMFAGFTHQPAITLAENLLSILPKNLEKIFYSDNGSTAVEVGLKMAMQYWYNYNNDKTRIIAIDGAYHGDTFGAMSVGERSEFTTPFFSFLFEVDFIDFPHDGMEEKVFRQFKELVDKGDVAAFIFEPLIQGASGMRIYSRELLNRLIEYGQQHNVICIADEVMTGFGRTGKLFASDHLDHKPDIICLSKGLTGGALPLGVTACNQKIVEAFQSSDLTKAFLHGHSFTANPMSCAAANASFELLSENDVIGHVKRIASEHQKFLIKHSKNPVIRDIRTIGCILAIEFNSKEETSYLSELRNQLYPFFIERDVLLRPLGNLIYLIPPYIISNDELQIVYDAIEEFILTLR
ncbi:MAG: adenosylmethionine--8-amino-7-oxononanoate transaminase [Bacteroidota bacterium]